ncbi:hypothetical protein B0T14DRAFT_161645 [Immersiella caudata]|uniref:Uncharacterized protein n=1 Tax=Immersiella caudata TaxID=314043 RepID=A0AA39WWR5_9PEZI|nr:hypothetical protein B0T14DRAFT_161645 [Immersiella caudata]
MLAQNLRYPIHYFKNNPQCDWLVAVMVVQPIRSRQPTIRNTPTTPGTTPVLVGLTPRAFDDPRRSARARQKREEKQGCDRPGKGVLRQSEETMDLSTLQACSALGTETGRRREQETRSSAIRRRSRRPRMGWALLRQFGACVWYGRYINPRQCIEPHPANNGGGRLLEGWMAGSIRLLRMCSEKARERLQFQSDSCDDGLMACPSPSSPANPLRLVHDVLWTGALVAQEEKAILSKDSASP